MLVYRVDTSLVYLVESMITVTRSRNMKLDLS
jgi:hypothetical protein